MRHRFGIRKKIMLTMAFMTIIPVLVMGIVSTAQSRNIICLLYTSPSPRDTR